MTATERTPRLPWAGPAVERRRDSDNAAEVVPRGLRVTAALGWRLLVVAAALWVLGQIIAYLSGIVIPVAIALLLAALLAPAVGRLVQWRVPRGLATAMVLVGGLAALGVLLTFVVRTVVGGVPQLGASLAQSIGELSGWLANGPLHVSAEQLQAVQGQLQTFVQQNVGGITAATLTTAATIGEVLTEFLLVVFTLIFFLHGGDGIWRFLISGVPARVRARVDVAGRRGLAALVHYVRATAVVAAVDAIVIGIGLAILQVPLAMPLATLVFLGAFIPIIGAVRDGRGRRARRPRRAGADHRPDRAGDHHRRDAAGEPRAAAAAARPRGGAAPARRRAVDRRGPATSGGSRARCWPCRCWRCSTRASGRCNSPADAPRRAGARGHRRIGGLRARGHAGFRARSRLDAIGFGVPELW